MIRPAWILLLAMGIPAFGDPAAATAADPLRHVNFRALRLAVSDLAQTYPRQYPQGKDYLRRLDRYEKRLPQIRRRIARGDQAALAEAARIVAFQREALLANPLLDFDKLLLVKRVPLGDPRRPKGNGKGLGKYLGLPQQSSWQLDTMPNTFGWENEIAVLSPLQPDGTLTTLYKPPGPRLVSDLELHFDAGRMMFSMPDDNRHWQVFEIGTDGRGLRQVSPSDQADVHNFDSCYLPSEKIAFISTAPMQGVPCNDSVVVGTIYVMDADGRNVRRLCFDQDHNYCPTPTADGRILFLRWEYADLPHHWPRILFTMNPDGTGQREFYGSASYWPNGIFYARRIPGHPTKVAGIVTGHHVGRVGELVIFDPARGRHEADGVVQRIPGHGERVEPIIVDKLALDSWPKFLHPYPLGEKHFIVACKPAPDDLWGIYLVDVFDNMTLLKEAEGCCLLEPIPLRETRRPPVVPQRTDLRRSDAIVYLENVYAGPGLAGVPHGAVKKLRLFSYHFAYQHLSGGQHRVGTDGPWEPKCVLGTVPVEPDGSAMFRLPANTPVSVQPLDAQGKALQLMRSWLTAMPGEIISCVGCHQKQNATPPNLNTIAARRGPSEIEPWYGPARGFSFPREVQPVLDKYCVSCHDGSRRDGGTSISDLRADQDGFVVLRPQSNDPEIVRGAASDELAANYAAVFPPAYFELRRFVRVGGFESDLHLLQPGEFHANTTELVQMLDKGHYGVKLDREAWDRLVTWIDLNAPCHGTWGETVGRARMSRHHRRRRELEKLYSGIDDDPEAIAQRPREPVAAVKPEPVPKTSTATIRCRDWPLTPDAAKRRQQAAGRQTQRTIDLGAGVELDLVLIPPGDFIMGAACGFADEQPPARVKIEKPFWMGRFEVTNAQYARFDPSHESRREHGTASWIGRRALGPPLDEADQPVVRISWTEAAAFCRWLSRRSGEQVLLPTEAQWEYACRAGSATPLFFGDLDTDFSPFANMADATLAKWAYFNERRRSADQTPRDDRFNDAALVSARAGRYRPNAWGLHDVHGNVWEWTRSAYRPYPYRPHDGRNELAAAGNRVARGGSWYDRPSRCRSAFRLSYPAWQKVYNVGFRVSLGSVSLGSVSLGSGRQ